MEKTRSFFYFSFLTPLGTALIGWNHDQIAAFVLPQPSLEEAIQILDSYHLPGYESKKCHSQVPWPELPDKINAYFHGEKVHFSEPVYLDQFPAFTRQVFHIVRNIPWGEVVTYQRVANLSSQPKAYRAVGQALGRNPIPLIIPCHRVIAKNSLGGFGYGLEWKSRLLTLEKIYQ